jgi:hypothetical protein
VQAKVTRVKRGYVASLSTATQHLTFMVRDTADEAVNDLKQHPLGATLTTNDIGYVREGN